jgi:predicted HD superfamily hydrolase involved in NAD metabolism
MNKDEMLQIVKNQLTEHRYQHTLGVVETAVQLAERYGVDQKKAEVAAIFHDYAKFRKAEEMAEIISKSLDIPKDLLDYDKELWHAPVGAYLVKHEVGITDEEVLDAIRFHTTGRVGMSGLEKVVCLADYIEPGRHFPGVEDVRELAKQDLNKALAQSLSNTIQFLEKRNHKVYPLTKAAYEKLILKKR